MENKFVYIVVGETGDGSEVLSWNVCAFLAEPLAQAFCVEANAWCKLHGLAKSSDFSTIAAWDYQKKPPFDPRFDCRFTGTSYSVDPRPLT